MFVKLTILNFQAVLLVAVYLEAFLLAAVLRADDNREYFHAILLVREVNYPDDIMLDDMLIHTIDYQDQFVNVLLRHIEVSCRKF